MFMPYLKQHNEKIEIQLNEVLTEAAEKLGIMFSCKSGVCGMCATTVISGEENLNPLTEQEEDLGMGDGMRLMCMCKLKKQGDVEIE